MANDDPHSLFVTEKVFKAMHQSQPFMVLGQRGHLRQLRDWGYETFGRWWDESYDDLPDMHDRAMAIAAQLRQLADHADLHSMLVDMQPVLAHNLQHWLSRRFSGPEVDGLTGPIVAHMRGN
jgi:hypothetical protein